MSQVYNTLDRRPGLVTFAAIMMFLVGGFQLVFSIAEFSNAAWITGNTYGTFGGYLWIWAIVDLAFAVIALYAGYDLLRGGTFGRVIGLIIATVSAVRWFFYIPAEPWIALIIIAVDILVIYGLVSHADYFRSSSAA